MRTVNVNVVQGCSYEYFHKMLKFLNVSWFFFFFFFLFFLVLKKKFFLAGTSIVLNADYITSAGTATLKFPIPPHPSQKFPDLQYSIPANKPSLMPSLYKTARKALDIFLPLHMVKLEIAKLIADHLYKFAIVCLTEREDDVYTRLQAPKRHPWSRERTISWFSLSWLKKYGKAWVQG